MFTEALSIWVRRFPALVLTAALALVPANFVMAGLVVFGLGALTAASDGDAPRTRAQGMQDTHRALNERGDDSPQPVLAPDAHPELAHETPPGESPLGSRISALLPLAWSAIAILITLMAGVLLAQAALSPLVDSARAEGPAGPAQARREGQPGVAAVSTPGAAWSAVAARLGDVVRTAAPAIFLTTLGLCLCVVPGLVLAVGFAFAMPVVMREGLSGRPALERSFRLMREEWPALLAWTALLVGATIATSAAAGALSRNGLARLVLASGLRLAIYPLPIVAIGLLHLRAQERAAARGAAPLR